jgi:hypothetical protein
MDIISEIINEIDRYIYGDKYIVNEIFREVINIKENIDPYCYHNPQLINKIKSLIEIKEEINNNNNSMCCICLENHILDDNIYFKCKHFVCRQCFIQSKMKLELSPCPLCRSLIEQCIYSDKYAIIALGIPVNYNTFANGGYKNISIVYFPNLEHHNNLSHQIFENITYHDECAERHRLKNHIEDLIQHKYTVILQNYNKIKVWLSDVLLKEYIYDNRLIHE